MTRILNFALKIKGGGREGGTCEVLRPCHSPKIWNVHFVPNFGLFTMSNHQIWSCHMTQVKNFENF